MKKILYYGGIILPTSEASYAEALLTQDGKIAAVGAESDLRALGFDAAVNLEGRTLLPSFIDSHSHLSGYANSLLRCDLDEAVSLEEIRENILSFIEKSSLQANEWIVAVGYDHNTLPAHAHPTRAWLDSFTGTHPVALQHKSGHMGVFNSAALHALGSDAIGSGLFEEQEWFARIEHAPMPDEKAFFAAFTTAQQRYASYGITTVQEGLLVPQLAPLYAALQAQNALSLDVVAYLDAREENWGALAQSRQYNRHFRVGGYKILLDGSPQGRTAWLSEPYLGGDACGEGSYTDQALRAVMQRSIDQNMQLLAHCNGDAACEQFLRVWSAVADGTDRRPVLIHVQLLRRDQLPRVKAFGAVPSFFAAHVYHWGDIHLENLGEGRARHLSPLASAAALNIPFTLHQDTPVIRPDMLETLWCAVCRKTRSGRVLGQEERISVPEALRAVTQNAARQYFEDASKGTLTVGKRADMVILDRNPLETPPDDLRNIHVEETIKDGASIFRRA